ncbi:uncharacterized protein MYCFIDRAFT_170380 [Pseudocercospora fijiensis CIRAD86]|uniref:Uncharacterized protein n=1 Tax=Pseudocercospora fijiensis (strain CIRAD86) TaxID=383855 RepID=N1Q7S9_PSEFD|nr:uncharacterized protein MYCFIDRAFT_170380 [Pseudocercospora fijiensis CIRAD86]EME88805.1 hypothetical protein MYCFIDRAFT_170380 [Pseudocercospora fijiensis CIRAD86]
MHRPVSNRAYSPRQDLWTQASQKCSPGDLTVPHVAISCQGKDLAATRMLSALSMVQSFQSFLPDLYGITTFHLVPSLLMHPASCIPANRGMSIDEPQGLLHINNVLVESHLPFRAGIGGRTAQVKQSVLSSGWRKDGYTAQHPVALKNPILIKDSGVDIDLPKWPASIALYSYSVPNLKLEAYF